ncbi:putative 3-oxoacyl-acyl-carrier protein synthase I/II [Cardiosporidium cionae]|uniref:3-oxoacyl-[acyl-carrier-protein] synthase n=1 Tax=Cardiosporidium cionae TaxID=476202 RepID=A0ABQ7J4Z0_9APIC|nr:putative 3-oxoacyl-acyl-carrier protein synthase I/II [Cardiosporidium cionae]|eukprot:KAF8819036.1 putative 3-oxoacyl-acyl-carrier protein synthase I/II [Cardiosporidium cionae]
MHHSRTVRWCYLSLASQKIPAFLTLFNRLRISSQIFNQRSTHLKMVKPRIVCTGLGVVSGVGNGIDEFWTNLINGKNNVDTVKSFDTSDMICSVGCEVDREAFDAASYWRDRKDAKRNDDFTSFAVAASKMALEDAGVDISAMEPERFGVIIGSGIGGIHWMEKEMKTLQTKGPRRVSPFLIPAMISNTAPGLVALEVNAKGPNHGVVSACATSGHAIGEALRYLQNGEADAILCGGSEASITPLSYAGFNALRAMAMGFNDNPKKASRPFDAHRKGFVMGEGAGILFLETEEHALRRNAKKIYGEMAAYAATCDAFHITAPDPEGRGLSRCLNLLFDESGVPREDVAYLNAHGTSTHLNDKIETIAFKRVFGEELAKKLLISSSKSMTGHCLGATGGIEMCVIAKVLETGIAPPTINYETPDPECDLNYCPNKAMKIDKEVKAVISDSLGFGGHNSALLLKRFE